MENRQNKILLDCRFWGPSHTGLGRYTQELVTAMQKLKPRFELVFLTAKMTKIKPYSFSEQRDLSGLIQSFKPDLTHFLHFNVPLNFPGPFVVTIHDLIKHHSRGLATTTHWPGTYWLKRLGASRRAALPETYNGAAWFFDPDNLDELVNQMKQALVLDPAKRRRQLQRAQAFCRNYSWKKTAQKTLEVYESCLGLRSSQ